jgi:hypothetical protein
MPWKYSNSSFIWIFPVGRGNCAFLRTGLNHGFILDMAEGDDGFDITQFLKTYFVPDLTKYPDDEGRRIAQALLSHPHEDHIARCDDLGSGVLYPYFLTCPNEKDEKEKFNWDRHGNREGTEDLIEAYKSLYKDRNPPLQSLKYDGRMSVPNMEYGLYYVRPPVCDRLHSAKSAVNEYGNATSIMFYYRHGNQTVLFPGDMTPEGMELVLNERAGSEKRYTKFYDTRSLQTAEWHSKTCDQPSLKSLLKTHGLSVLVGPHHGLESCYSTALYDAIYAGSTIREHKPQLVCISERRKRHENDGNTDKRYYGETGSTGIHATVNGKYQEEHCITTKSGLHVLLLCHGSGPLKVFANSDPVALLGEIKTKPYRR